VSTFSFAWLAIKCPGEQLPGEQLSGEQMSGEQMSGEQLSYTRVKSILVGMHRCEKIKLD